MFKGVDDQQIIISYKDLSLQTFINIDRDESLHVSEAFRNASPCGWDIYRRVYLKVRESDSPFLLKRRSDSKEASTESMSSTKQPKSLLSSFASSVNSGVDKTWGRPWPRPWRRPWPTLWPTLWLTGGQIFKT